MSTHPSTLPSSRSTCRTPWATSSTTSATPTLTTTPQASSSSMSTPPRTWLSSISSARTARPASRRSPRQATPPRPTCTTLRKSSIFSLPMTWRSCSTLLSTTLARLCELLRSKPRNPRNQKRKKTTHRCQHDQIHTLLTRRQSNRQKQLQSAFCKGSLADLKQFLAQWNL